MRLINWYTITLIFLMGCGGSLNDEQRKQMREARELNSIKKVSDVEIMEAAFAFGRDIMEKVEAGLDQDSLELSRKVAIRWLQTGSSAGSEIERQVIDAYLNSMVLGAELADNVQRLGTDSLLYTKPVVVDLPDGVVEVKGTWNIRMSKKQVVLSISKK
ncbi:MAG: hypothetical protein KF725_00880 [Cyclobacteriaceae bacterium]|nr:hypothetical protein [Cyclobacteriaceae bacterium]UYN86987.1 MAG: hypothetical protein KIT51_01525 [Cyclobacteriaceae bacterium]